MSLLFPLNNFRKLIFCLFASFFTEIKKKVNNSPLKYYFLSFVSFKKHELNVNFTYNYKHDVKMSFLISSELNFLCKNILINILFKLI